MWPCIEWERSRFQGTTPNVGTTTVGQSKLNLPQYCDLLLRLFVKRISLLMGHCANNYIYSRVSLIK